MTKLIPENIEDVRALMADLLLSSFIPINGRLAVMICLRAIDALTLENQRLALALRNANAPGRASLTLNDTQRAVDVRMGRGDPRYNPLGNAEDRAEGNMEP